MDKNAKKLKMLLNMPMSEEKEKPATKKSSKKKKMSSQNKGKSKC